MNTITGFKLLKPYENEGGENPYQHDSLERVSKELVWKCNGSSTQFIILKGFQASLINHATRILVIDGVELYDDKNKAYVVNGMNEVEVNLSDRLTDYSINGFYFQDEFIFFFAHHINERLDYLLKFTKEFTYLSKSIFK